MLCTWDKLKELREHPELADTPGYELEILRRDGDPVMWFLLLIEQPAPVSCSYRLTLPSAKPVMAPPVLRSSATSCSSRACKFRQTSAL